MSLETSKIKCSACGAYLFEEDETVYCPECGAPHHRDCYNSLGHCAFAEKHGTPEQYSRETFEKASEKPDRNANTAQSGRRVCTMCGTEYDASEPCCPECKTPDPSRLGRFTVNFDYLGGVPADMDLGEGVTADEAKRFVFANTQRFIPKFAAVKLGKKASFNWLAFFFPSAWFLCRKMYKQGILTGILHIAFTLLFFPFYTVINAISPDSYANMAELVKVVEQSADKIGTPAIITAAVGFVLMLALQIICGVFADYFYRNHCIETVKKIKTESEDADEDYRKKGGVNIFMFLIGVLAIDWIPQILFSFLK